MVALWCEDGSWMGRLDSTGRVEAVFSRGVQRHTVERAMFDLRFRLRGRGRW